MTGRSQYDEALYRLEASDWQRQEDGGDPMQEAAVAQVHATLAVADELRRMNDGRDSVHREVLEVLTQAKEPVAPLRCEVCGKPGHVPRCLIGPLTREQWKTHYASLYQRSMNNGGYKSEATRSADTTMRDRFGPCPKEGP